MCSSSARIEERKEKNIIESENHEYKTIIQ